MNPLSVRFIHEEKRQTPDDERQRTDDQAAVRLVFFASWESRLF
jgi:hypothetical protein